MSRELLDTAEYLLTRPGGATASDQCRAISTLYYALFHFLAGDFCKSLICDPSITTPPSRAWDHLYRSLAHTTLLDKCKSSQNLRQRQFPQEIIDFALFACEMQIKRERCDYGHNEQPQISSIQPDINNARIQMSRYETVDQKHRKAFAIYILFKRNRAG